MVRRLTINQDEVSFNLDSNLGVHIGLYITLEEDIDMFIFRIREITL